MIVIGSAALAAKPRKRLGGGKEFGWVEALAGAAPKALIIDEGQDTKERAANRSRACEQLAAAVTARDGLILDLTGTAILNRPRELCQQLAILGRIGEFGGPKAFLWRYCLSGTNQWGASYNGARNLLELGDRLRACGIMVRRSDDAALGLPPCREHVLRIPQADLDPAVMARYRHAEADLLGYLAEQARQAAQQLGQDPDSAAVQAVIRASAAEHLVAIGALRQLAGQAKRGYVTARVRGHVAAGEKVMVAAHHRDEVDAYAAEFGGLKVQGGQPVEQKEAAKAAFQQQPAAAAPVICVAIGAGGVGHTLTAARIGVQAEQAWTPGETQQMKKRLHRIGQDRPVDYYITIAEGTIDEHLWQVVTAKQADADLYVLTPQMLDVVIAAAQSLTFADLGLLREDDLPSPSGTVILPRPLVTRYQSGTLYRDVAFSWRSPSQVPLPGGMGFRRAELPAVRMSEYTTAPRSNRSFMQAAREQRVALPPMLLEVVWSLPLHPDTPGQAHDYDLLADALRRLNTAYWQEEARNRKATDQGWTAGEYASGAVLDEDQDGTLGSRFLYAFWRLCEQQIGAVQPAPTGHSAQVTAARAGVNPDVRVVALRRAGPSGRPAAQTGPHQWHHHWVVRMHKVRQWYPGLQQHKVIYRGPFVKGDMAKPLLGGEVVRGLVR